MPEITIKYKKPETLKILKGLAINGVTIIPRDKTSAISELENVFTGAGIDAKKLRKEGWKR